MHDEDFSDSNERPSKTRQKKAMHELRDLGAELVELSAGQLKRIDLPEDILAAVRECQKITAHGAHRRQLQYLGKLMRGVDDAPIRDGLAVIRGESGAETARLHRLERMRTRLLDDEAALSDIAVTWPGADLQQLRQLRRNALQVGECLQVAVTLTQPDAAIGGFDLDDAAQRPGFVHTGHVQKRRVTKRNGGDAGSHDAGGRQAHSNILSG